MCKFCSPKGGKDLMFYDNRDSMNISYGQYQGVNVMASLLMKGNMLVLSGTGSYRSESDCYYEDEGLDCDSEGSTNSNSVYLKIAYCPFCGKKIESYEFENRSINDKIVVLEDKLEDKKAKLARIGLHARFSFVARDEDLYKKARDMVWEKFKGDCKLIPLKLETILKEIGNLKVQILYGLTNDSYYRSYSCPAFDPEEGVKFDGANFGEFHGRLYSITEEQYHMLADMGLIKENLTKLDSMRTKGIKYQREIDETIKKIAELKKNLK